jgi:hypothetical protein
MIGKNIGSYDELTRAISNNNGIATILMQSLRDIHGADRLGVNVIANIQLELLARGIGHSPATLPNNQYAYALLYRKGGSLSKIIEQLSDIKEDSDAKLRDLVANEKIMQTIAKIKEIVCD